MAQTPESFLLTSEQFLGTGSLNHNHLIGLWKISVKNLIVAISAIFSRPGIASLTDLPRVFPGAPWMMWTRATAMAHANIILWCQKNIYSLMRNRSRIACKITITNSAVGQNWLPGWIKCFGLLSSCLVHLQVNDNPCKDVGLYTVCGQGSEIHKWSHHVHTRTGFMTGAVLLG